MAFRPDFQAASRRSAVSSEGDVHSTDGQGLGEFIETWLGDTLALRIHRRDDPRSHPQCRHLIPSQLQQVTFLPNTKADIYAELSTATNLEEMKFPTAS